MCSWFFCFFSHFCFVRCFGDWTRNWRSATHISCVNWWISYKIWSKFGTIFLGSGSKICNFETRSNSAFREENNLTDIVQLIEEDSLSDDQKLIFDTARILNERFCATKYEYTLYSNNVGVLCVCNFDQPKNLPKMPMKMLLSLTLSSLQSAIFCVKCVFFLFFCDCRGNQQTQFTINMFEEKTIFGQNIRSNWSEFLSLSDLILIKIWLYFRSKGSGAKSPVFVQLSKPHCKACLCVLVTG